MTTARIRTKPVRTFNTVTGKPGVQYVAYRGDKQLSGFHPTRGQAIAEAMTK